MERTVTHEFGTAVYQTTALEDFVEELAAEFGVDLPDLSPYVGSYLNQGNESNNPKLWRERSKRDRKGNLSVSVLYQRNPSSDFFNAARNVPHANDKFSEGYSREVALLMYTDELYSEFVYLIRKNKKVAIEFDGHSIKRVTVHVEKIEDALARTIVDIGIDNLTVDDAAVRLNFNATAPAFNFVQNYLRG